MTTNLKCAYCNCEVNLGEKSKEHVFPKGLGGDDTCMNCVCAKCNNSFSNIEGQLLQNSIVGLMRSAEGVKGRSKNKARPASLKHQTFYFDEENKIVYEAGVYSGLKSYIRPQFIKIGDNIYIEGDLQKEREIFEKMFKNWKSEKNLIMVTKFHQNQKEEKSYDSVKFYLRGNKYVANKIEPSKKAEQLTDEEVTHYSLMKHHDKFKEHFQPRIYLDDSDYNNLKLNVRSRNLEEGIQFVIDLLNYCNQEGASFRSYSEKKRANPGIFSLTKFDEAMVRRALVKIGLNALMYYYPETQYNSLLKPAKDFVLKGTSRIGFVFDTKSSIADTRQDTHLVLFHQSENGLYIRMRLFGGHFNCQFLIEGLQLPLKQGEFSVLEVDFKKEKQKHYTQQEFILKIIEGSNECLPPVSGMN